MCGKAFFTVFLPEVSENDESPNWNAKTPPWPHYIHSYAVTLQEKTHRAIYRKLCANICLMISHNYEFGHKSVALEVQVILAFLH